MKNTFYFLIAFLILGIGQVSAQVAINTNGAPPDPSAMLDVSSTDKGFLPPRMTTEQKNAIVDPVPGLMIYDINLNVPCYFNGSEWVPILNGNQQVYSATTHISSPEILAFHTSPKQLLPGLGAGNRYQILSIDVKYTMGSVPYVGTGCLGLFVYQGDNSAKLFYEQEVILRGNTSLSYQLFQGGGKFFSNSPVMVQEWGAQYGTQYTAGNGVADITVVYVIQSE